jgi:NADPH:quinone reductase-like Zn-dependent oxidoreductase
MKILVTGGTGKVGTEVVQTLLRRGASVRVLTRNKEAKLPHGAEVAIGDLLDPDSVRSALNGVDKLFLLVGNVADELTQALLTVAVARQAKVKHITYLSVYQAERFPDVPHFIGKYAVRAEALYLTHRVPEALEVIKEAEALAEKNEERCHCAELLRLRGVFLIAMRAPEIQIEASFCDAIRTAKRQKSISLAARAEASYEEYRSRAGGS